MWKTNHLQPSLSRNALGILVFVCIVAGLLIFDHHTPNMGDNTIGELVVDKPIAPLESDEIAACVAATKWAVHIEELRSQAGLHDGGITDLDTPTAFQWHDVNSRQRVYAPTGELSFYTDPTRGFRIWRRGKVRFEANLIPDGPTCVRVMVDEASLAGNCVLRKAGRIESWSICSFDLPPL